MNKVLTILADGFEEIEAVTVIDMLRRAAIDTTVAGLGSMKIRGSHGISIECDIELDRLDVDAFDYLVLPGGQPGSSNLKSSKRVLDIVKKFAAAGKVLAAICAAPTVLQAAGVIEGKRITSYPSEKNAFSDSKYLQENVVVDDSIITSRGVGTAIEFALRLIQMIKGEKEAREQSIRILFESNVKT